MRRFSPHTRTLRAITLSLSSSSSLLQIPLVYIQRKPHTNSSSNEEEEKEKQRELEEEEFRVMDAEREDAEMLPIAHRLAAKADALDMELQRLSYVLFEKPQLVVDTTAATITGRPTSILRVLQMYGLQKKTNSTEKSRDNTSMNSCTISTSPPPGWKKPVGSSSPMIQMYKRVYSLLSPRSRTAALNTESQDNQLATLTADLDYLRRMKQLHALNYYSRMNMIPKRHIWLALYAVLWNMLIAVQNAIGCVVFGAMRGVRDHGITVGILRGTTIGTGRALLFLSYGFLISPVIHIPRGLCNSVYGVWSAFTGKFFFEASAGRWQYCTVRDAVWLRHELRLEQRAIRGVGRLEFRRKNMQPEEKWKQRLMSMGFSFDKLHDKMKGRSSHTQSKHFHQQHKENNSSSSSTVEDMDDPYEVLQLKRSATQAQVKAQYKTLAKVFHPDVVAQNQTHNNNTNNKHHKHNRRNSQDENDACSEAAARHRFARISQAYQILSNTEKRRAYDLGGARALRLHESNTGRFMSRTPEEMVQSVFGGAAFQQTVLGPLLRSHWHLRNEAQVSVSLHEFEELQCLRCRELAVELAKILDVHANANNVQSHYYRKQNEHDPSRVNRTRTTESVCSLMDSLGGGGMTTKRRSTISTTTTTTTGTLGSDASSSSTNSTNSSPFVLTPGSNAHNMFSRDFEERCDRYTRRLSEACFGRELIYAVGQSYIISSQRFLGILPFYAPKLHVYKKIFSGIDRVYAAFREKIDDRGKNNEWLAQKVMLEYFSMEYDAVVADVSVLLRYSAQCALQDITLTEEQRRRRCYALWYLGEQMVRRGTKWTIDAARDDGELMAYIQQAANSASTTSKPGPF
ncbi:DnaJ domain [Trypanosoma melophagium]|uniref:DnaJ domain n=1 Tax=Trypanosoma melophagium TaxID=715481 RepID=UPI003519FA33|nr:DnaJ domain [Trypanosoma melophagium]